MQNNRLLRCKNIDRIGHITGHFGQASRIHMSTMDFQKSWGIHIEWMVDHLLRNGITLDEISATVGRRIDNPAHVYLPIDDYLSLFDWSAKRLSAPHLGLDIGDQLNASLLGILGYLIQNAPTVAGYCEMLQRYQSILMTGMEFSFRETGRDFVVEWQIFRPPSEGVRHDIEMTLAGFLAVLRDSLKDRIVPKKVLFSHASAEPLDRYSASFGTNVSFNQDQNCLIFSSNLLGRSLNDNDPNLLAILREHADIQLQQSQASLVDQAKFIITTSLETEDMGAEKLASMLNLTTRTLNRHLRQKGTNYQKLREEVILDIAKQLLADTDANITVIGGKLGFSESSTFIRAFKRMTGTTPAAFRKKVLHNRTL